MIYALAARSILYTTNLGMPKYLHLRVVLALVAGLTGWVCSPQLFAQGETTSAILGQVMDETGSAIPRATVTIRSTDNGLTRSIKTDDAGRSNSPQLNPGTY